MKIKVKKLSDHIPDLHYAKPGDAGFDLYTREHAAIAPGAKAVLPTGISLEIPEGYVGLIWDKSGLSSKYGLKTFGGVIDSGYRGEIHVVMTNLSDNEHVFEVGDRVAQVLIQKFEAVTFEMVDELSESERGHAGFGSSGR
jgi:dUTP pyrophosphatase